MENKNDKQCPTHAYLTEAEENGFVSIVMNELNMKDRYTHVPRALPAPAEMCDLIY